jgi:hypothetical protein
MAPPTLPLRNPSHASALSGFSTSSGSLGVTAAAQLAVAAAHSGMGSSLNSTLSWLQVGAPCVGTLPKHMYGLLVPACTCQGCTGNHLFKARGGILDRTVCPCGWMWYTAGAAWVAASRCCSCLDKQCGRGRCPTVLPPREEPGRAAACPWTSAFLVTGGRPADARPQHCSVGLRVKQHQGWSCHQHQDCQQQWQQRRQQGTWRGYHATCQAC